MGWFDDDSDEAQAHAQVTQSQNKASLSHELIAGAASFEAARAYEQHCDKNGKPQSHEMAKELLAGFAGAFVDREAETVGMDEVQKLEAKRAATQNAQSRLADSGDY